MKVREPYPIEQCAECRIYINFNSQVAFNPGVRCPGCKCAVHSNCAIAITLYRKNKGLRTITPTGRERAEHIFYAQSLGYAWDAVYGQAYAYEQFCTLCVTTNGL